MADADKSKLSEEWVRMVKEETAKFVKDEWNMPSKGGPTKFRTTIMPSTGEAVTVPVWDEGGDEHGE